MKLNFNKTVTALDGEKVKDEHNKEVNLAKIIAHHLATSNKGDALKLFSWALKLQNGEVLDLDKSDQNTFKDFINESSLNNLVKYQVLIEFDQKEK